MAENPKRPGVVDFSPAAQSDVSAIYTYTAQQWSQQQAEAYLSFLNEILHGLASDPSRAPFVANLNRVRSYTAKQSGARQGHRIFFVEFDGGINIIRILHTARNWRSEIAKKKI